MSSLRRPVLGAAVASTLVLASAAPAGAHRVVAEPPPPSPTPCAGAPWMDRHKSPDQRARLVLAQLTVEEKISLLGSVRDAQHFRETLPIDRLCIPALRLNNGSAGVSTGGPVQFPATALPAPIGLAATFDPKLAERYGYVGGRETRDQGRDLLEGPAVDLARVPLN